MRAALMVLQFTWRMLVDEPDAVVATIRSALTQAVRAEVAARCIQAVDPSVQTQSGGHFGAKKRPVASAAVGYGGLYG